MSEVREGDWVRVYGQVTDAGPHPEEYRVRIQSHNEDYSCLVRRDWCERVNPPEDIALLCTSLFALNEVDVTLVRCVQHHDHAGDHAMKGTTWTDDESYGYVEEK